MFEYHSLGRRRKVTYMKFFVISKNGWSNKIYIQKKSGRGNTLFIQIILSKLLEVWVMSFQLKRQPVLKEWLKKTGQRDFISGNQGYGRRGTLRKGGRKIQDFFLLSVKNILLVDKKQTTVFQELVWGRASSFTERKEVLVTKLLQNFSKVTSVQK